MGCQCFLRKCALYSLHLRATCFRLLGWGRVMCSYYVRSPSFAWTDVLLAMQYIGGSPYNAVRQFCAQIIYGETPLTTWDHLMKKVGILSTDCVYELGGGTGRLAFWLVHFVGCRVVSIEQVPALVRRAERVKRWRGFSTIQFREQDLFDVSFSSATWIYFYGTTAEDEFIVRLCNKIAAEAPRASTLTVSYPLSEWDARFCHECIGEIAFPWGRTLAYTNRLIDFI